MVAITFLQIFFALIQEANWVNWFNSKQHRYGTEFLCSQVAQFAPNMCEHASAKQHCNSICRMKDGNTGMLRCGKKQIRTHRRYRRIVGGSVSEPGEWPWRVSMMVHNQHICGGTLLSEYFILTAMHCFNLNKSTTVDDWLVIAGNSTLPQGYIKQSSVKVRKIISHPQGAIHEYNHTNKVFAVIDDDIAIVALAEPIKIDGLHKGTICLPDLSIRIPDYNIGYVSGWGHLKFKGKVSSNLRHAPVPIVPSAVCNMEHIYNNTINGKKVICAGYKNGGIDACYYDSGGSLDSEIKGKWYAIGIVSSGYQCAEPNAYGLYTNISSYKEWIIDTILTEMDK